MEEEGFEYDGDVIRVKVMMDDVSYNRYLKEFEPVEFEKSRDYSYW